MNKLIISFIALGALSGVALADSASEYDRDGFKDNFGLGGESVAAGTSTNAIAAVDQSGLNSFQKAIWSGKGDGSSR